MGSGCVHLALPKIGFVLHFPRTEEIVRLVSDFELWASHFRPKAPGELALFFRAGEGSHFHNPLRHTPLRSFCRSSNWLCFFNLE